MPAAAPPHAQPDPAAAQPQSLPALDFHFGPLTDAALAALSPALADLEGLTLAGEAALWGAAGLAQTLSTPQAAVAVVHDQGQPIAYCLFTCVMDECEVLQIATHPRHSRQGIGRRLLQAVLDHAAARGCAHVLLEVRRGNHAARGLYDRLGFQTSGVRRGYYHSHRLSSSDAADSDALLLARPLSI